MLIVKEEGGCTLGPFPNGKTYEWIHDGDAVDVDPEVAATLLAIDGGGFSEPAPDPEPPAAGQPAPDPVPVTPAEPETAKSEQPGAA
ncbi:MAG TPA: hypothetical protein VFQ44_01950 [Streptosporangiaceae bacterium]|nr:hypothetical protein [Streptosporangiaceae bacterium]